MSACYILSALANMAQMKQARNILTRKFALEISAALIFNINLAASGYLYSRIGVYQGSYDAA